MTHRQRPATLVVLPASGKTSGKTSGKAWREALMDGIRIAAAAALMLVSPAALAQEIGGTYQVQGQNNNGSTYTGTAVISGTAGGNCSIRWTIANTPPSQGFCMRQGNVFAAAYRLGQNIGLVVYRLGADGALDGTWTVAGTEGVGRERLVPAR